MDRTTKKYMVEFMVPFPFPIELESMIPDQRLAVHKLFIDGKMLNYTLAQDRSKLWAIFFADSESELLSFIHELPMSDYMDYNYTELMFHEAVQHLPAMSLN